MDAVWIPRYKAGMFVWSPAPTVSVILIENPRQAKQKRNKSAHVLRVTRILWSKCRMHAYKSVELIIETTVRCGYICPREMHETLMLVIYFPYLNRCPWELWKTKILVGMGWYL